LSFGFLNKEVYVRLIVGISGASGSIYGIRLCQILKDYPEIETHLVITETGVKIIEEETHYQITQVIDMVRYSYQNDDLFAPISSGSFITEGMVVAPCSAKTLSAIANSYTDNLLTRAADVVLKERRKLVLLFRETPLHLGHLDNMRKVTEMGGIILPPIPVFYHHPKTIDDLVNHTLGKVLDLFGISHNLFKRWDRRT
jgi:4-hydroxy-3-polyprenylbenzoate decarboxylase